MFTSSLNFNVNLYAELQCLKSNIEGKFAKKGGQLTAELYQRPLAIHIRNITKNYDEELLRYYFETTKRSGGGEVKSVKLQQTGEAVIEFQDQSGNMFCYSL